MLSYLDYNNEAVIMLYLLYTYNKLILYKFL